MDAWGHWRHLDDEGEAGIAVHDGKSENFSIAVSHRSKNWPIFCLRGFEPARVLQILLHRSTTCLIPWQYSQNVLTDLESEYNLICA